MPLSESQIESLLQQRSISDVWPWVTDDESIIDRHIKDILAEVRRKVRVEDRTEFNHYGSGYASYVDCWLYRPTDEFRYRPGNNYYGLVVLFSRLTHHFVMGEGSKSWDATTGSRYLPTFRFIDVLKQPAVIALEKVVESILTSRGLCRLHAADLSELLPSNARVPTCLNDGACRHFDALFYWED